MRVGSGTKRTTGVVMKDLARKGIRLSRLSQLSLTSLEVSVHLVRLEGAPGYRKLFNGYS